jgi:hypothetical protein
MRIIIFIEYGAVIRDRYGTINGWLWQIDDRYYRSSFLCLSQPKSQMCLEKQDRDCEQDNSFY